MMTCQTNNQTHLFTPHRPVHRLVGALLFSAALVVPMTNNGLAAPADGELRAISASQLCSGHSRIDPSGNVVTSSNWVFRNYDAEHAIRIDRIRIYDNGGYLLYEANPPLSSSNGVDPAHVMPHGTISFHSSQLIGDTHPQPDNPIQFILDWSAVEELNVISLDGFVVRINRNPDGSTAAMFSFDCRTSDIVRQRGKR